jgi:hypothetical protein
MGLGDDLVGCRHGGRRLRSRQSVIEVLVAVEDEPFQLV